MPPSRYCNDECEEKVQVTFETCRQKVVKGAVRFKLFLFYEASCLAYLR